MRKILLKGIELGFSGFGGLAMLGSIKKEFVEDSKLIKEKEFYEGLSVSHFVPGTTAGNLMAYIAYKIGKARLMYLMQICFLLPAVFCMLGLSYLYFQYGEINIVQSVFKGLNIAVVVLLIKTAEKLVVPLSKKKMWLFIMLLSFSMKIFFSINIFLIILTASLICIFFDKNEDDEEEYTHEEKIDKKEYIFGILFIILFIITYFIQGKNLYIDIFHHMAKIGFLSFGGGVAAISLIQETYVNEVKWISQKEFISGLAIAQMTPGPILNISVYIGYKMSGVFGSLVAAFGIFTPGVILMQVFASVRHKLLKNRLFRKIISGILLGFNGIIIYIVINFFNNVVIDYKTGIFFVVLLGLFYGFKIRAINFIILSGIASYFYF